MRVHHVVQSERREGRAADPRALRFCGRCCLAAADFLVGPRGHWID